MIIPISGTVLQKVKSPNETSDCDIVLISHQIPMWDAVVPGRVRNSK